MNPGSETPPGNGKGHPWISAFHSQTSERSTPTVWELKCKLELHLQKALDAAHEVEFGDDEAIARALNESVTNITEVIREIHARLKK
jgi:hypothetical protein